MINVGKMQPPEIPSQLGAGDKCVVFRAGPTLCIEISPEVCDAGSPDSIKAAVMEAISRVREDPFFEQVADTVSDVIERSQGVQQKVEQILQRWERKLAALGLAVPLTAAATMAVQWSARKARSWAVKQAMKAGKKVVMTPAGIIFVYVVVYVAIRYTQIIINHNNSNDGGVLITIAPPYYPIQISPQIWPRGGYTGEKLKKVKDVGGKLKTKLQPHVKSGVDALKSKVKAAPKPRVPGRR